MMPRLTRDLEEALAYFDSIYLRAKARGMMDDQETDKNFLLGMAKLRRIILCLNEILPAPESFSMTIETPQGPYHIKQVTLRPGESAELGELVTGEKVLSEKPKDKFFFRQAVIDPDAYQGSFGPDGRQE